MSTAVLFKVTFGEGLRVAMRKQQSDNNNNNKESENNNNKDNNKEGWKIPILIHKAVDYIKSKVTVSSGIFKVAASKWKVQKLKEEFERGAVGLSKYNDPHSVAGLLLLYLRALPEHIISDQLQTIIIEAYKTKTGDEFIGALKTTVHKSVLPNKLLLKYLLLFLHHVLSNYATNKVDAPSLALAWAPVFFPSSSPSSSSPAPDGSAATTNTKEEVSITEILIENYSAIWESGEKKTSTNKTSSAEGAHHVPPSRSPLPTPSRNSSSPLNTSSLNLKTLAVANNNGADGKRAVSPNGVTRPSRPSSALSTTSTIKGSPARGKTPPLAKSAPPKSTTPSRLTKSVVKKKAEPVPIRSKSPALPRPRATQSQQAQQQQRSRTPSRTVAKKTRASPSPAPPSHSSPSNSSSPTPNAPPPLPLKRAESLLQHQQLQQTLLASPSAPPLSPSLSQASLSRSPSQVLQRLVDTDLNSSDFRAADSISARLATPSSNFNTGVGSVTHGISEESANEKSATENEHEQEDENEEESGNDAEDEDSTEEEEIGKSTLLYQENDILFNNRLSGSFVSIPKLKLGLVLPYDFQTAPKKAKSATKSGKSKAASTASSKSSFKKAQASAPSKASNKMLTVPKNEHNSRTPSPQPKPRPHSSHTLTRPFHSSSPTTPLRSHHSPHPPSSAPSRALKTVPEESSRSDKKKKKDREKDKIVEEGGVAAELLAKNKAMEAEILALRSKLKDGEEKLANEEKNVSFLLSRVEILDRQRMEAVNKIIDEKSQAEKELRVRISTLEADVLVLKDQLKMTENSADVKAHSLSNQTLELEARVTLLQAQLDRAYEEIAEKDNRISVLESGTNRSRKEQENGVEVIVLDSQQCIDTPKPPNDSTPFYYHHPFAQSEPPSSNHPNSNHSHSNHSNSQTSLHPHSNHLEPSKMNGHGIHHPLHKEHHAWKAPATEEFGDVSL